MLNLDWVTFFLKLVLVPTFIGIVSLAGRRWGTAVSGWLVGLPLTSGPVAFFLAIEQGDVFASKASQAILFGIISVYAFCVTYARVARYVNWLKSAVVGVLAFFLSTLFLDGFTLVLLFELPLVVLALTISLLLIPHVDSNRVATAQMRREIPARMLSATILVLVITSLAPLLGSQLTGLLSPFPVYATTLAAFTHRSAGGEEAAKLLGCHCWLCDVRSLFPDRDTNNNSVGRECCISSSHRSEFCCPLHITSILESKRSAIAIKSRIPREDLLSFLWPRQRTCSRELDWNAP